MIAFKQSLRRRFLSRTLAIVVAVMAAFTVSTAPSSATEVGTATLSRTLYLTDSPKAGAAASMNRSIYLAAGTYSWSSDLGSYGGRPFASRYIYLAAGWYSWKCTLRSPADGYYQHTCSLDHGAGPAYLVSDRFTLTPSGQYTMESFLQGPF
ncbi:hypothetical protein ACFW2Y_35375 [Streptomyces sp. NPDC058877]|uniref:hypothetical protein n=1 Tax=Streptomyces sp. NPDC058877 TaxID=3346665 RepID=UPI0036B33745